MAILGKRKQIGGRGDIPIPNVVVYGLKVPESFARIGVQRKKAVGKEVIPFAVSAIKIKCRRAGGRIDNAFFSVKGHAHPVVGPPDVFVVLFFPGLVAEFSWAWNGVESPDFATRPYVVSPNIAQQRRSTFGNPGADNQDVFVNRRRRVGDNVFVGTRAF